MKQKDRKRVVQGVLSQLEEGIPIVKACKNSGIHRTTLYTWAKRYKEFEGLTDQIREMTKSSHEADAPIAEATLFQRAIGGPYQEETQTLQDNPVTGKKELAVSKLVKKMRAPDTTALIFLLCNLAREDMTTIKWQSVFDIKIEKEKLDSIDDLIQKWGEDVRKTSQPDPSKAKKKGKKDKTSKAASEHNPSVSQPLAGESEEERRIREGLVLEMSDKPGVVGGDLSGSETE